MRNLAMLAALALMVGFISCGPSYKGPRPTQTVAPTACPGDTEREVIDDGGGGSGGPGPYTIGIVRNDYVDAAGFHFPFRAYMHGASASTSRLRFAMHFPPGITIDFQTRYIGICAPSNICGAITTNVSSGPDSLRIVGWDKFPNVDCPSCVDGVGDFLAFRLINTAPGTSHSGTIQLVTLTSPSAIPLIRDCANGVQGVTYAGDEDTLNVVVN